MGAPVPLRSCVYFVTSLCYIEREMSTIPLSQQSVDHLLLRAAECDAMAATATTPQTMAALQRLAARYRTFARQKAATVDYQSGVSSLFAGKYQLHNIFGTPDGRQVILREGESFPAAPRGFVWRLCRDEGSPSGH
jgi:hypothetical protein